MIRRYCDGCGDEILRNEVLAHYKGRKGRIQFEVILAVDDVWNAGEVCHRCLMDALNNPEGPHD